jgi:hypothetical protein
MAQTAEVNWVPRAEVNWAGTQYLGIHPGISVSVQVAAVMSGMGNASSQWEALSSMVNRCLLPPMAAGKGPTMSKWMCVNHLAWTDTAFVVNTQQVSHKGAHQAKIAKGRTGNKVNRQTPSTQHPTNHRNNNLHGKDKSGISCNRQKIIDQVTKKVNIAVM